MNALPPRDHNHPPEPLPYDPEVLAECERDVTEFTVAAGIWKDLGTIETQDQSEKATDFVSGARKVYKRVDDARKAAKKPHDDAAKVVQAAFAPLLEKIERSADAVKKMQLAWAKAEDTRIAEELRIAAEKAEAARQEALRLAAEAEARNDISGVVDAETALKEAEAARKAAERPVSVQLKSATGGGRTMSMRTIYQCRIASLNRAFVTYRDHPGVSALLIRLAEAEVRGQKGVKAAPDGFELYSKETIA